MLTVATRLAESSIHGIGVFAAEQILHGTLIWIFDSRVDVRLSGCTLLPPGWNSFIWSDSFGQGIDGDNARFMNHSDNPNTVCKGDMLYAARDIGYGEEITIDYTTSDAQCSKTW